MGKIIKAEKRGGGGIESKVIEEYTSLVASWLEKRLGLWKISIQL